MSPSSYLRGRQEIPEPPSIAARRRNSNAASLQLQPAVCDVSSRSNLTFNPQTPSPKQTFGSGKVNDYFRFSQGDGSITGMISPPLAPNFKPNSHQRQRSSHYGQPPTPGARQHIPAWNLREEQTREALGVDSTVDNTADDPLHILDTLPIQNMRIRSNAPASDSRCGTLKRPAGMGEERRATWPKDAELDPTSSALHNRRNPSGAMGVHGTGAPGLAQQQSRPITSNLRPAEPSAKFTSLPEPAKPPR